MLVSHLPAVLNENDIQPRRDSKKRIAMPEQRLLRVKMPVSQKMKNA
jgi:hypothetical protein